MSTPLRVSATYKQALYTLFISFTCGLSWVLMQFKVVDISCSSVLQRARRANTCILYWNTKTSESLSMYITQHRIYLSRQSDMRRDLNLSVPCDGVKAGPANRYNTIVWTHLSWTWSPHHCCGKSEPVRTLFAPLGRITHRNCPVSVNYNRTKPFYGKARRDRYIDMYPSEETASTNHNVKLGRFQATLLRTHSRLTERSVSWG